MDFGCQPISREELNNHGGKRNFRCTKTVPAALLANCCEKYCCILKAEIEYYDLSATKDYSMTRTAVTGFIPPTQISPSLTVTAGQQEQLKGPDFPSTSDSQPKYPSEKSKQKQLLDNWGKKTAAEETAEVEAIVSSPEQSILTDISEELDKYIQTASSGEERAGLVRTKDDLLACASQKSTDLDLSDRSLTFIPACVGKLTHLLNLNISGNKLVKFPADQILQLTNLQTIQVSMQTGDGTPKRRSHEALMDEGYKTEYFKQGNANAKILRALPQKSTAFYTTDLDPCVALMIIQNNQALAVHVDTFDKKGIGGMSTMEILGRHIKPNNTDTKIFMVGANAQGSAGNVRGILTALKSMGLHEQIQMASLGNGFTSATMDLKNQSAYMGKG